MKTRRTWALDWRTGWWAAGGVTAQMMGRPGVGELLAAWPAGYRRVYLVGRRPFDALDELRRWALAELPDGWAEDKRAPHHLASIDSFVLHFRDADGKACSLLRAAPWFGEGGTPADVLAAFRWLYGEVRSGWGADAGIFDTPQTTGRDLWCRQIDREEGWPVLPVEVRELIHACAGQGRVEPWWERDVQMPAEVPGIVEWDGTLMYAPLCRELGCGPVRVHDRENGWPGPEHGGAYAPAWYQVRFTVPDDWAPSVEQVAAGVRGGPHDQVGLIGVKTGDGWRYPNSGTHTAWVAGPELHLAWMAYGGANIEIRERLVLTRVGRGPLQSWSERLVAMRERAGRIADPVQREMCRRAARALILTSIGAFASRARQRTVHAAEPAPGLRDWTRTDDGYVWTEDERGPWNAMCHPEWAAQVWSRARVRMLTGHGVGALHVNPRDILGIYVDALFVIDNGETDGWPDQEVPGRLRRKHVIGGPVATPGSWTELWSLRGEQA